MFFPCARILPMRLTLIFGSFFTAWQAGLILFLGLKTVADVLMHFVERREKSPQQI